MSETVINVQQLSKLYKLYDEPIHRLKEALSLSKKVYHREYHALRDVSFKVTRGEILGIVGRNGAGKSTLLKMITGVVTPTEGEVEIQGKVAALLELGAGFNPEYTGLENIYINGMMLGYTREEMDKKVDEIMAFAEIGDFIHQPVKIYSSGMFARLAFSVAINVDPDILIADEVLSVGDVKFQDKCINKMKSMVKEGKTILFVSHDLHAIKYFCDRVIWLKNGELVADGKDVVDVIDQYQIDLDRNALMEEEGVTSVSNSMLKITATTFLDQEGNERKRYRVGESFSVRITYEVFEEVGNVFFGVGMRNSSNVYVSGLNTKLDDMKVSVSKGVHTLDLVYEGVNLYKEIYTVWSVCYNSSGTVVMSDYIMKNALEIYSPVELGEGVVYITHQWRQ